MKYAYYPGCSSESTASDMHISTLAVARALGIELCEIEGWSCCGSSPAHQTDHQLSVALPAVNLLKAKTSGMDMVVTCASCFNRMKTTNHQVSGDENVRREVKEAVGQNYDGSVKVRHFIEVLLEDVGISKIKSALKARLNGLKVAAYYGCLLVRPHEITGFDDAENPQSMEKLIEAIGGEPVEWPHKVECCGAGLSLTQPEVALGLCGDILGMAQASGAQCIAVTCPLCQSNLDLRQKEIESRCGKEFNMPVAYMTQLLGLCLGLKPEQLGMNKLTVSPRAITGAAAIA
jgi:heterodisulfide reductase subunit B2